MIVFAVGAHPDDLEILCGGTLARLRADGAQIHMCVVTDGALGSTVPGDPDIVAVRRAEARAGAEVIGATLHWIGEPDGFLFDTAATRRAVATAIRHARPDVLLAHAPTDYHPDHRAAGAICAAARQLATAGALELDAPAVPTLPDLWYMDTLGGSGFDPDLWVDIGDVAAVKARMIDCHAGQNAQVADELGRTYTEIARVQGAARGAQCGVPYAECFRHVTSFPVRPGLLAQLGARPPAR